MAEKVKKPDIREDVYAQVAADLLARGIEGEVVVRYKEGLRLDVDGETFIIRVIKKKVAPKAEEITGNYEVSEADELVYTDTKKVK